MPLTSLKYWLLNFLQWSEIRKRENLDQKVADTHKRPYPPHGRAVVMFFFYFSFLSCSTKCDFECSVFEISIKSLTQHKRKFTLTAFGG